MQQGQARFGGLYSTLRPAARRRGQRLLRTLALLVGVNTFCFQAGTVTRELGIRAAYPVAGALRGIALLAALPVLVAGMRAR